MLRFLSTTPGSQLGCGYGGVVERELKADFPGFSLHLVGPRCSRCLLASTASEFGEMQRESWAICFRLLLTTPSWPQPSCVSRGRRRKPKQIPIVVTRPRATPVKRVIGAQSSSSRDTSVQTNKKNENKKQKNIALKLQSTLIIYCFKTTINSFYNPIS